MMVLHGYWRSSASYRVRIALALKKLEVRHKAVNLKVGEQLSGAHRLLNPQPLVPVLELKDGTMLTQSLVILDYLEQTFPDPALLPEEGIAQAKVKAAAHIIASDISPIQNLRVLQFIREHYGCESDDIKLWAKHWIHNGLKSIEYICQTNKNDFFLSDTPGYFECCLVPQLYNARRFGVDLSTFPLLTKLNEKCCGLTEFIQAAPENQADSDIRD
ncbi:MAG: maleylacetoacetate isomerase [Arenicella sp.]